MSVCRQYIFDFLTSHFDFVLSSGLENFKELMGFFKEPVSKDWFFDDILRSNNRVPNIQPCPPVFIVIVCKRESHPTPVKINVEHTPGMEDKNHWFWLVRTEMEPGLTFEIRN